MNKRNNMMKIWVILLIKTALGINCEAFLDISLPGTHDSGAYYLTENIQPYYDNQPEILYELIEFAEDIGINISKIITPWALSQDRNVSGQISSGIQYIDFRCGWNGTHWNTFHFETGVTCLNMLKQIAEQVKSHPDRIFVVEVSHLNGSQLKSFNIIKLANEINSTLGDYLFPRQYNLDFSTCDMINSGRNILLTLGDYMPEYSLIWYQPDVIINTYANSPDLLEMIEFNKNTIIRFNSFEWNRLFKLSWTLTPNADLIIDNFFSHKYTGLKELADTANKEALVEFNTWRIENKLKWPNIVIIDHYETSEIIKIVNNYKKN